MAATTNITSEIIVVDNNSMDDSCAMVKTLFPDVKLIENNDNKGFSKGNNIGVEAANGEYICILNPDTVVGEDIFDKLLDFVKDKAHFGAVGCKLINGVGAFLQESKRNIPYVNVAIKKFLGNDNEYYANHLQEVAIGKVDILVGAFMFMKKNTYKKVGGFDEDYFMYGEDIDLSYKLLTAGYTNYYYGKSKIIHFKGESTLRDKNYAKRFYGAMQIFYKKHFKKNIFFDVLVRIGIQLVYLLRKVQVQKIKYVYQYVLISNTSNNVLKDGLSKMMITRPEMSNFQKETEIILDANYLTYGEIIDTMNTFSNTKKWTFKILPKDSRFIIGSDNAVNQGEIITF